LIDVGFIYSDVCLQYKLVALPKLTHRFRLSTGHFCRAAEEIFTQHNMKYKLNYHRSFGLKFNVPVGFLWFTNWLKFAYPLKRLERGR